MLETRVRDESGVWVTAPAVEVVLLLTRYALKLRGRDIVARRRAARAASSRS